MAVVDRLERPDIDRDVDYWAARGSIVAELTPNLENYTIVNYNNSFGNGYAPRLLTCPALGGGATEDAGMAAGPSHPGGCACCAAPRSWSAEAV